MKDIIQRHEEKWDDLVQLLLDFRNNIEKDHKQGAKEAGLTETEYAFFNILLSELEGKQISDEEKVKDVVQSLVQMLDEATQIVDFFNKWDEQKGLNETLNESSLQTLMNLW